ncbi:MAG: hypothetical protein ACRDYD_02365, partial [Acidimicrobiales bacterium]
MLASGFSVLGFDVTGSTIYVFDGTDLRMFALSGAPIGSFALPATFTGHNTAADSGPFVDPAGDIWMGSYYGTEITKFAPSGQVLWSSSTYGNSSIVGLDSGNGYEIGVMEAGHSTTQLLDTTGQPVGTFPVVLSGYVSQAPGGNLLQGSAGYVNTYTASGQLVSSFGDSQMAGGNSYAGAPHRFFFQGQAVEPSAGGPIYTADPASTIEETTPDGHLLATTNLGGALQMSNDGGLYLLGGTLYFAGGSPYSSQQSISSVPLSVVQQYLEAPQAGSQTLGWGAGVTSGAPGARVAGNYFRSGAAPSFYASFDPWWLGQSGHLQLSYSIWSSADMRRSSYPSPATIALPTSSA